MYLPDSVAAKMAASAFLTTGKIQGFPSAVRYAPTPRLTYECRKHQEIYTSFLIMASQRTDLIWMGVILEVSGELEDFDGRSHLDRGEQGRHLGCGIYKMQVEYL